MQVEAIDFVIDLRLEAMNSKRWRTLEIMFKASRLTMATERRQTNDNFHASDGAWACLNPSPWKRVLLRPGCPVPPKTPTGAQCRVVLECCTACEDIETWAPPHGVLIWPDSRSDR